tara:strand:- start:1836 stop:2165 length:330 start_codon:yes stop_codon:yes gene_type:complete
MRILITFLFVFCGVRSLQADPIKMVCDFVEAPNEVSLIINEETKNVNLKINNIKSYSLKIIESNPYYVKARSSDIIFSYQREAKTLILALANRNDSDELGAEYFTGSCS